MADAQAVHEDDAGRSHMARLDSQRDGDRLVLRPAGSWTTRALGPQESVLARLNTGDASAVRFELDQLQELDTAGAFLLYRTMRTLDQRGLEVEMTGARKVQSDLIDRVSRNDVPSPPPPKADAALPAVVIHIGEACYGAARESRDLVNFLGYTVIVFTRTLLRPWRIRTTALISHMERTGLDALPIVGLISFLIGVVLAYQGADQLARFGAQLFTANLVGIGVLREMGIILTAIMVAGRSGSAFTAQIGTMKVNEEIDAMRTIGLDPMEVLVVPRILALVLVMPLLTFYADILGILGGAVMATLTLDITFEQFFRQLNTAVPVWSFWVGIIKAPIFAFIIGMVGCYEGLKVTHSAESVGLRTTSSMVKSIFLVIVLDAMFSILFAYIGI